MNQENIKLIDKKTLKKINILRIISGTVSFFLLCVISHLIITTSDCIGILLILSIVFGMPFLILSFIVSFNLINYKKNILSNIKIASILEIIIIPVSWPVLWILLQMNPIITISIFVILIFTSINKLVLLKGMVDKKDTELKNTNKKNIIFAIGLVLLQIIISIISLSIIDPNQNYKLNKNNLKQELNNYTYVSEKEINYSGGFSCRDKTKVTYVSFSDYYNNDIIVTIDDINKGNINKELALINISKIQLVNNILNNQALNIIYNKEVQYDTYLAEYDDGSYYKYIINDPILSQYFSVWRVDINFNIPENLPLYKFDLKNIDYNLEISLTEKANIEIDYNYLMPYIESYVTKMYETIGVEKIKEFSIGSLDVKEYSQNSIIWE